MAKVLGRRSSSRLGVAAVAALGLLAGACGSDNGNGGESPFVAVLSAFPAELSAVLEWATVDQTVLVEEHVFRVGTLGGIRVVLAMTGIGLVNAAATTSVLLQHFDVTGIVVSGVAGSPYRIGDVTVPAAWTLAGGGPYAAHPPWLTLAEEIAKPGEVSLQRCTRPPDVPSADLVCLPFEPAILVGGIGNSSDPFGGAAFPCQPNGQFPDVFGCDVPPDGVAPAPVSGTGPTDAPTAGVEESVSADMESAAIAAEAAAHGVPFIAFRAVSDGEGDPLDLPGFPDQFFSYYRLAAHNAAAAAVAFLERLAAGVRD